jgi:hypothetical protein
MGYSPLAALSSWVSSHGYALLRALLLVVIFLFLGRYVFSNFDDLKNATITLDRSWLLASFLVAAVYVFSYSLIWQYITMGNGCAIPLWKAITVRVYSEFGKYVPGRALGLGMVVFSYSRYAQAKKTVSSCLFLEYLANMLGALFTFIISLCFVRDATFQAYRSGALFSTGAFFVLIHPKCLEFFANIVLKRTRFGAVSFKISYSQVLFIIFLNVVNWVILGSAMFLFINAVHGIPATSFVHVTGLIALASLAGLLSLFTPAGLGVREGLLVVLLLPIMPRAVASVVAVGSRLLLLVAESTLFCGVFLVNGWKRARLSQPGVR